jgi:hypothetical protein
MWRRTSLVEEVELLPKAIEFTGNAVLYGSYMQRTIREWPISCAHNLSDTAINRQAWVGHAATCIALGCPEHITRRAWWHLTQLQQDEANAQADQAIADWEYSRLNGIDPNQLELCLSVD